MKKLLKEYGTKSEAIQDKIKNLEEENETFLKNGNAMKNIPQSLPYRYAETLLKGDKSKNINVRKSVLDSSSNDKNFELKDNNSGLFSKPNMAINKNKSSPKEEAFPKK